MHKEGRCSIRVGGFEEVARFIATMQGGVEDRRERIRLTSEAEKRAQEQNAGAGTDDGDDEGNENGHK
jgi:hypothetical protein